MQIHELNTFAGTPGAEDFLAIDNGNETNKIAASNLGEAINPYPTYYGTSGTAAVSSTKIVTCPNFSLKTGAMIAVKFTNTNSVVAPSMNVNSTGAKTIKTADGLTDSIANAWAAGAVVLFVYDGSSWVIASTTKTQQVTTPTSSITDVTTGSVQTLTVKKYGNICQLHLYTKTTAAVPVGSNCFKGTLSQSALRPITNVRGIGYSGSNIFAAGLNTNGDLTIRNTGSGQVASGADVTVTFTYLVE